MKRTVLFFGCALTIHAHAGVEQNRAMFDMMKSMASHSMQSNGPALAKCLGTSESKLQAYFDTTAERCFAKHKNANSQTFGDLMGSCIETQLPTVSGISQDKIDRCGDESDSEADYGPDGEISGLMREMDKLQDKIDELYDNGAPESKIAELEKQLDALAQNMGEASMDMDRLSENMGDMIAANSEATKQTLHLITLPLYPNHQVMMHAVVGGVIQVGDTTASLPAATFYSTDTPQKIVSFYESKLKGFKKKTLPNGDVLFMRNIPPTFDLLKDMKLYMTSEHVLVRAASDKEVGAQKGTKAFFEIAYQSKP